MSSVVDLRGRHLLSLSDYSREEIVHLIDLAADLKLAKQEGREEQQLVGKQIALVFETGSCLTRGALDVAAHDQGAHVTYIGPAGSHLGHAESVKDTARVLGRMYDAIEYVDPAGWAATALAEWAGVPVYHGLAGDAHPTQVLADLLTFDEHVPKPLDDVSFCYLGDARFRIADGYLVVAAKLGMDVRVASPRSLWPPQEVVDLARRTAALTGGQIMLTEDVGEAVGGCDAVLTDVWISAEEQAAAWNERIRLLLPYQVNARTMALTGNPDVKFMHPLPALHSTETTLGAALWRQCGLDALEVTDEVFESPASLVFDEAENRVHTVKAVLVATLGS